MPTVKMAASARTAAVRSDLLSMGITLGITAIVPDFAVQALICGKRR